MRLKFLLILVMMLNFSIASASIKWVDRIVMIVNDDVVTQRDLNDMMFNIKKQAPRNVKIDSKQLREAALERLLEEKLLVQFAKNRGVEISEEEIDDQISNIASSRHISVAKVYELTSKEGVDEKSLRNTIANNLMVQKVLNDFLPTTAGATEEEINNLLTNNNIPITQENIDKASIIISKQKFQQSYMELIQTLRSSAYIKFNNKAPY